MDTTTNSEIGYLIVQTFKAGMGLPVEGAQVTVRNESGAVERVLTTDRNGQSETIALPAPPMANSLTPENPDSFSKYAIQTEIEGYYPVENLQVPVFSGQTTLQQVALIPLPLGYVAQPQIIEDTEPEI